MLPNVKNQKLIRKECSSMITNIVVVLKQAGLTREHFKELIVRITKSGGREEGLDEISAGSIARALGPSIGRHIKLEMRQSRRRH